MIIPRRQVYDLTSVIKSYIGRFSDPLVPYSLNSVFHQIVGWSRGQLLPLFTHSPAHSPLPLPDISTESVQKEALQVLLLLCPPSNRVLLQVGVATCTINQ